MLVHGSVHNAEHTLHPNLVLDSGKAAQDSENPDTEVESNQF